MKDRVSSFDFSAIWVPNIGSWRYSPYLKSTRLPVIDGMKPPFSAAPTAPGPSLYQLTAEKSAPPLLEVLHEVSSAGFSW